AFIGRGAAPLLPRRFPARSSSRVTEGDVYGQDARRHLLCSAPGRGRPVRGAGACAHHQADARRRGDPGPRREPDHPRQGVRGAGGGSQPGHRRPPPQPHPAPAARRPTPPAPFLAEQFGSGNVAVTQYTFNVGQPIELGGKRQRRIDSAKAATRVTDYELTDVRRQVIFQVKKSFTDILVARESLTLAEQNLTMLDELERVHRLRAEKGDISGLELLRLEIERFAFDRDATDARQ